MFCIYHLVKSYIFPIITLTIFILIFSGCSQNSNARTSGNPSDQVIEPVGLDKLIKEEAVFSGWSILLGTFNYGDHHATAIRLRNEFTDITNLQGAWVESYDDRSILRYGRYDSYTSQKAHDDLDNIKSIKIGTTYPFKAASLAPIGTPTITGSIPQYNLLNVREQFPGYDEIYTLQIASYQLGSNNTPMETRQAAEQAVLELRKQGEQAFYYHGPRMSLVTVGLFFDSVIDTEIQQYVPEVLALQKRFPYNAYNGYQMNRKLKLPNSDSKNIGAEPSFLVEVPRKP